MTLRRKRLARRFRLAVFLLLAPLLAQAASFGISPVRVELSPAVPTAALTLRNGGEEPALVQVRAVAWSQQGGEDVYEPTSDVIVSPPIFTLAGNGAQIVRVGLRRAPDAKRELSYRIFLQEVHGPQKPGATGLQMALRIGLPVFVKPLQDAKHELDWRASRSSGGKLRVVADNRGHLHVQVIDFRLVAAGDGKLVATQPASAYLLPGQSREWLIEPQQPLPATAAALRVRAETDAGELSADVALDVP